MTEMMPFTYGEFYDVPRSLIFRYKDRFVLLKSSFDEEIDEYPDNYEVYVVSDSAETFLNTEPWDATNWATKTHIGQVPITQIEFDESRRKLIDASFVNSLLESQE